MLSTPWTNSSSPTSAARLAAKTAISVNTGAIMIVIAMVILNHRVVASLRISLWMSLFMPLPPGCG